MCVDLHVTPSQWSSSIVGSRVNIRNINVHRTRDLAPDVLTPDGQLKVMPAEYWRATTLDERVLFATVYGYYSFPTVELVQYVSSLIDGRTAIEIGAGHGGFAKALGIPATDNRMQTHPAFRLYYALHGQPTVRYGRNVIECSGNQAVRQFRPQVAVACWVTHRFDPNEPEREGNPVGLDEGDIIANVQSYIFVGNEEVHRNKPIWNLRHRIEYPPFLFSRATTAARDFVAVWGRS